MKALTLNRQIAVATDSLSSSITRRRFLRKSGKWVFGATATAVLAGLPFSTPSRASLNNCSSPCGPSPICSGSYCTGHAACKTSAGSENQKYSWGQCVSGNNWWYEPYCTGCSGYWGGKEVKCGDCCAPSGGSNCAGCSGTKKKCICRRGYLGYC